METMNNDNNYTIDLEKALDSKIKKVCRKEFCNEFKEWIFSEVVNSFKPKPLSIVNIKKKR